MAEYVMTYHGQACITGLAYMELPEVLQKWVDKECHPAFDADVYILPTPHIADFKAALKD